MMGMIRFVVGLTGFLLMNSLAQGVYFVCDMRCWCGCELSSARAICLVCRLQLDRWVMMGMIGFVVGLIGFLLHQLIEQIADFKWETTEQILQVSEVPRLSVVLVIKCVMGRVKVWVGVVKSCGGCGQVCCGWGQSFGSSRESRSCQRSP